MISLAINLVMTLIIMVVFINLVGLTIYIGAFFVAMIVIAVEFISEQFKRREK